MPKIKFQSKELILCIIKPFIRKISQLFYTKYDIELAFQTDWAKEFVQHKHKVLEYWEKYRYLHDIERICKITDNSKVLDIGCGLCTVLHYIQGKRFGIDPLAMEYKKIYEYPEGIHISEGCGEKIPFSERYFDVVLCSNVIDHVTNPKKTILETYRILKPNGYFFLSLEIFRKKIKRDKAHPYSFTKEDIYLLLKDKFEIIFEKESPWIGIKNYVNGLRKSKNSELVLILRKINSVF